MPSGYPYSRNNLRTNNIIILSTTAALPPRVYMCVFLCCQHRKIRFVRMFMCVCICFSNLKNAHFVRLCASHSHNTRQFPITIIFFLLSSSSSIPNVLFFFIISLVLLSQLLIFTLGSFFSKKRRIHFI